ncbi:MAG: hypothetical protein GY804_02375 [Alphaproteobacteria bacterium]|nr:hypothetical protein [Alphaproteobacteria bacterium]
MQYVVKFTRENCDKLVADYPAKLSAIYGLAPKDNHENRRRHQKLVIEMESFLRGAVEAEVITKEEYDSKMIRIKGMYKTILSKWKIDRRNFEQKF